MRIKKYIVNDMKEAIIRAKYELGSEAIILDKRTVKIGKWFNPFKKTMLEVTVAIEQDLIPKSELSLDELKNTDTIEEKIYGDNLFKYASENFKEKLLNYCKLNEDDSFILDANCIRDFLQIAYKDNCLEKKCDLAKINVLIGPTGVGKTTTIAKIAANKYLKEKKKVGFITIDTYRIGAVEQLKAYANIINLPFEVANEADELYRKINKLSYCDIILIDTIGTSFKDMDKLSEIKEYIDSIDQDNNVYLVISASTDKDTLKAVLDKYKFIGYDALILTKLDEVSNLCNFWDIVEEVKSPIQYFCSGQDVPEDIKDASVENLLNYFEEIF